METVGSKICTEMTEKQVHKRRNPDFSEDTKFSWIPFPPNECLDLKYNILQIISYNGFQILAKNVAQPTTFL